jgi:hypothetical protein
MKAHSNKMVYYQYQRRRSGLKSGRTENIKSGPKNGRARFQNCQAKKNFILNYITMYIHLVKQIGTDFVNRKLTIEKVHYVCQRAFLLIFLYCRFQGEVQGKKDACECQ